MSVFYLFLLATIVGCVTTLFWIPEDDLGRGYFQMNALIVLGLTGLLWSVVLLHPFRPFGGVDRPLGLACLTVGTVGAFLYYAAIWTYRWRQSRWAATLCLLGTGAALVLSGPHLIVEHTELPLRIPLLHLALWSSALILGWSLITMLLGHWYLVAPKLTFRHLVVFCWVLLFVVLLRVVAVGGSLWAATVVPELTEPHPFRVLTGFGGQGMFFWFRLLWGLLIPLILAVLSLHCARNRSNQSATGILYVLVVGAFIGEITAYYLIVTTGVPA